VGVEIICPLKQRWHSHGRDQVSPATQQHHEGFFYAGSGFFYGLFCGSKRNRLVKNAGLETLGQVVTTVL